MLERFAAGMRQFSYFNTIVQIFSNKELRLENCRRILEYNDIRIVVQTTDLTLQIWGKNLYADTCSSDGLLVKGEIQSIEFLKKGALCNGKKENQTAQIRKSPKVQ